MSKKIIATNLPITPHNQPVKVIETAKLQRNVYPWNERILLWKDSDSRLGRL